MRIKLTVCSIVNCSVSNQHDQNARIPGHFLTWGMHANVSRAHPFPELNVFVSFPTDS